MCRDRGARDISESWRPSAVRAASRNFTYLCWVLPHNPARHCFRQYRVEAGTDLFGVWVVEIRYGRIRTAGRSRSYVVRDEGEARHLARSILKRQATAPRRIMVGNGGDGTFPSTIGEGESPPGGIGPNLPRMLDAQPPGNARGCKSPALVIR
jgi:hypothetical protein